MRPDNVSPFGTQDQFHDSKMRIRRTAGPMNYCQKSYARQKFFTMLILKLVKGSFGDLAVTFHPQDVDGNYLEAIHTCEG